MNFLPRDVFKERLHQALIGPGADVWELKDGNEVAQKLIKNSENTAQGKMRELDDSEILSNFPLQTYYSAMLFPEREQASTHGEGQDDKTLDSKPGKPIENAKEIKKEEVEEKGADDDGKSGGDKAENATKDKTEANSYFPTNFGLTFCVASDVQTIKVAFTAGLYADIGEKWLERKVKIDKYDFEALKNNPHFPFKDEIWYEGDEQSGYLFLSANSKTTPSELRARLRPFYQQEGDKSEKALERFKILISERAYKRQQFKTELEIPIQNGQEYDIFTKNDEPIAKCYLKVYEYREQRYVKIVLKNTFEKHPREKFSFANEVLNQKTLFQTGIRVEAALLPYKSYLSANPFDKESQIIDFQYRDSKNYGIGHGCAVRWSGAEEPAWIETTFLPEVKIPAVTNEFRSETKHLEPVARLKNLSVWSGWDKDKTISELRAFVNVYENWIREDQEQEAKKHPNQRTITDGIIDKQRNNVERLHRNIDLLASDEAVFQCFQLANTAMLIQMIISIDKRFGAKEKEWSEISQDLETYKTLDYKTLSFFENYETSDYHREINKNKPIAYRPFQLAFLLLNLEPTVNLDSPDRRKVVDLIWFPTGGGKTEAYLALTAFTILWRRLQYPENYEGVSVIMRYTLRLLTSQQFERASRLIVALEFMRRRQKELQVSLGDKPITIGMWVGLATTPNNLKIAGEKLGVNSDEEKTIDKQVRKLNLKIREGEQIENADAAYRYNVFQISACPWCGCKTITKNAAGEFKHGYSIQPDHFKISCRNTKCDFYDKIPVDVVDESLYNYPPTLLFATVDKFAQLAHVAVGHKFFNSLKDNGLPPDLIIQDELHLLNGPLGSVVGLFELLVERLCTKGKHTPKIVASTATTRNTDYQIGSLYGGRQVNVFPPQGLSATDNFFSKTTNESKRLHVGFMPTGKTMIDAQVFAVMPNLLLARVLLKDYVSEEDTFSNYWTLVSYYNSLKSVGKIYNKVGDEIYNALRQLHDRLQMKQTAYNYYSLASRTQELTSRVESSKIKTVLKDLEAHFQLVKEGEKEYLKVKGTIDLVLASNMFSVGIDIGRLNVILMNGQPKNIAEYIQASSRVARRNEGIVINLLDGNSARERSYFENYVPFHQAYYRFVEPLTVTPFTEITFEKVLNCILVTYVRQIQGKNATEFDGQINDLITLIQNRIPEKEENLKAYAENILRSLATDWYKRAQDKISIQGTLDYKGDLMQDDALGANSMWAIMQSMRDVDTTSLIEISIEAAQPTTEYEEILEQQ